MFGEEAWLFVIAMILLKIFTETNMASVGLILNV